MKKSLLLAAAVVAAIGANAQVVTWDFNTHGIFAGFQDPEDPFLYRTGNYDFVDKYGKSVNTDGEQFCEKDEEGKWHGKNNRIISLYDGVTYAINDEEGYENGTLAAAAAEDPEILNHPFIGWNQDSDENPSIGPSRTIWMIGWGTLDEYADANYNAIDADNWVSTKHAIAFLRNGNSASRQGTYVQFPAVQAPCTITYYVGTPGGSYAKTLRATIQPVIDGVEGETIVACDDSTFTAKRYYKKEYRYEGEGMVSFRIGCDANELYLYHVEFASGDAGVSSVSVDSAVETRTYNLLGCPVDETYRGVVIRGGKKYYQR